MITIEIPVTLTLAPSRLPRSEGVHVSSIIRCIATESGILRPEWAEELSLSDARSITDPVAILRISMGLAWEEWYIPTVLGPLYGAVDHPGEMEYDGVYLTHDAESLSVIITDKENPLAEVIHEVKLTYKSTNTVGTDIASQWMWISQIKAYCKAKGTRFAMLHVLFVCGDYTYPIKPILKCWQIEFTQQEIDDNWDLLFDYMRLRQAIEAEK